MHGSSYPHVLRSESLSEGTGFWKIQLNYCSAVLIDKVWKNLLVPLMALLGYSYLRYVRN